MDLLAKGGVGEECIRMHLNTLSWVAHSFIPHPIPLLLLGAVVISVSLPGVRPQIALVSEEDDDDWKALIKILQKREQFCALFASQSSSSPVHFYRGRSISSDDERTICEDDVLMRRLEDDEEPGDDNEKEDGMKLLRSSSADNVQHLLRFCGEDGSRADNDDADDSSEDDGDSDEVNPKEPHNRISSSTNCCLSHTDHRGAMLERVLRRLLVVVVSGNCKCTPR